MCLYHWRWFEVFEDEYNNYMMYAYLITLVVLNQNADGNQRVRHQSSNGHHLYEGIEIKKQSRQRHQNSTNPGRQ